MKALCWHGKHTVRYETVADPAVEDSRDAIVEVRACSIGGADLHLYDAVIPGLKDGDVLGRECVGEVVEIGAGVSRRRVGERVVVPFAIACGECDQCRRGNWSVCETTNPHRALADKVFGHATGGLLGCGHLAGGYPGGQAQYVRVPHADVAPATIPDGVDDERALFVGDSLATGWQAAAQCEIEPGDVVAVWGAGAVGLFAAMSARLLGAAEVIAIDRVPERLALAQKLGATPLDFERLGVADTLAERTRGKGPDKCIDAVGLEAQAGEALDAVTDRFRPTVAAGADQPHVLREMIYACRPGGVLSVPGVYGGLVDKLPMGALMHKGLTLRAGQTHVCRWTAGLLEQIADGRLDPSCVITHRATLEEGPAMYETFGARRDGCIRPVLRPRH